MSVSAEATWQGSGLDTSSIEHQMGELWKSVTSESANSAAVRTSILNLVVFTASEDEARGVSQTLRDCATRHPSRTLILVSDRNRPGSSIDASAAVHCLPTSGNVPLCYEEITITGHGRVADHLSSVVMPLLVAELPTYLWWPGQPAFGHRVFNRLLGVSDQLVIDSARFLAPGDGFANLARIFDARQGVNDFNWSRLRGWREVIAQFFDGPTWHPYVESLRSIHVQFGAGGEDYRRATAGLLLLVGWVGSRLGWRPESTLEGIVTGDVSLSVIQGDRLIDINIDFRECGGRMAGQVISVEMVAQPKGMAPARFAVERLDDMRHAKTSARVLDGVTIERVVPLEVPGDPDLLTAELEHNGHDPLYESVINLAARLSGREVWNPPS